jgi:hypothetical protein
MGRLGASSAAGIVLLAAAGCLVCEASRTATAETGPCLPDQSGGLTCGQGNRAARVVQGTVSPSRRLAFAWRSPSHPPTEDPTGDAIESVLIRLSDGMVLWSTDSDYWDTGAGKVNHIEEAAAWSPNSRFAVETADFRWYTRQLRLYAIGADNTPHVLDLKPIIEPAVRRHLRQRARNEPDYDFAVFGSVNGERPHLTIDDRGLIKAVIMMAIPKQDRYAMFDVALQVSDRNGTLGAWEMSVRNSRTKPY